MRKNYSLVVQLALNDFKLRYHGSILGYFWTLIKPLLLFTVLYIVFSVFMRFPVEHYQLYLLLGVILWNFFSEATSIGLQSLLSKAGILTKHYIPRWTIVAASLLSSFLTLLLNLIIFLAFYTFSKVPFHPAIFITPLLLLEFLLIAFSLSLVLSVAFIRFRDLSHIWDVLLQIGFWITPIIYPTSIVDPKFHWLFKYNPISILIDSTRNLFIKSQLPSLSSQLILLTSVTILLLISLKIFNTQQKKIIEHL